MNFSTPEINQAASLIVNQLFNMLLIVFIAGLLFFFIKGLIYQILNAMMSRFSEIGVGCILEVNGEKFRIQKKRFSYIQLIALERKNIILRIPLKTFNQMNILIYSNGIDYLKRQDDFKKKSSSLFDPE